MEMLFAKQGLLTFIFLLPACSAALVGLVYREVCLGRLLRAFAVIASSFAPIPLCYRAHPAKSDAGFQPGKWSPRGNPKKSP